ncbi:hypothetical protein LTR27_001003 [Elasticomyces elasticus]|nr:hypothetical protein LTR27_001003 [Elasticomyces elasticus]
MSSSSTIDVEQRITDLSAEIFKLNKVLEVLDIQLASVYRGMEAGPTRPSAIHPEPQVMADMLKEQVSEVQETLAGAKGELGQLKGELGLEEG